MHNSVIDKPYILILLLLGSISMYSKNDIKLKGQVLSSTNDLPIAYSSIVASSISDSLVLFGAITDSLGYFSINNLLPDNFILTISCVGYESLKISDIKIEDKSIDLGKLRIKLVPIIIDEVTINGSFAPIKYFVDRKVIYPNTSTTANVAMDLLVNVPSLHVDIDGKLTYRGDGSFKVLINGHPTPNGEDKLRQIPVSRIQRIEIITNPSAKFSAEGSAGIIQVILKKNRLEGYNINSSIKYTTLGSKELDISIDNKTENSRWYINSLLSDRKYYSAFKNTRYSYNEDTFMVNSSLTQDMIVSQFYIESGFNFDITENDNVDFSINYVAGDIDISSIGDVIENYNFAPEETIQQYYFKSKNISKFNFLGSSLSYEHPFDKNRTHIFKSYFDISTYICPNEDQIYDNQLYGKYTEEYTLLHQEDNHIYIDSRVDYKNTILDSSSLELGLSYNCSYIPKASSSSEHLIDGILQTSSIMLYNQRIDFCQNIYSAYLTFSNSVGRIDYQIGLRGELTDRRSNYFYVESLDEDDKMKLQKKQFYNIFPSLHCLYTINDETSLGLSFSRRINRPFYWSITPIQEYKSPYSVLQGNQNLKPSFTNSLEILFQKTWGNDFLNLELYSKSTDDVIQEYAEYYDSEKLIYIPQNVGKSYSTGCGLMYGNDYFNWLNINTSINFYYYILNVDFADYKYRKESLQGDAKLINTFTLPYLITLRWDFVYEMSTIMAQYKKDAIFYSDISLTKKTKNKRWMYTCGFSNLFNTVKYSSVVSDTDFKIEEEFQKEPFLSFKLTYLFDNQQ